MIRRLATRLTAAPRRTLAVLLLLLAVLGGLAAGVGRGFVDDYAIPGSDAQDAVDLLAERFPEAAGDSATVVLAVDRGTLTTPGITAAVGTALDAVAQQPGVVAVVSPFAPEGAGQVAADGRTAFATVQYDRPADDLGSAPYERLEAALAPVADVGVEVSASGPVVDVAAVEGGIPVGEVVGIAVALVVLLLLFRSLGAVAVTLGSAFVALAAALALLYAGTRVTDLPTLTPTLAVMLGLGAGIDYALLLVARHRAALAEGAAPRAAAVRAATTAGVSVLTAGAIVMVSIAGLLVTGIPFVTRMGVGAALAVAVVAIGAVVLVPTLLTLAGRRLLPRVPGTAASSPGFARWAAAVSRRPGLAAVAATAVLLALAAPVLGLRLGMPDDGNRPTSATQRVAYDRLSEAFGPGTTSPLLLAAALPADGAAGTRALDELVQRLADDPGVAAVTPPTTNAAGDAAVLSVISATAPQDEATAELVDRTREVTVPAATAGTGTVVHVGGVTAVNQDLADRVAERLPVFVLVVVGLSLLLLVVVFRSLVVPLVSALFNLLSVVAAYGVVVLVFQRGVGNELIGVDGTVPIVSFIPLFMFALLFGLSMDYNVFLLSRVAEERRAGRGSREAVLTGVATTGRVISAAAAIMVAVFGAFVTDDDVITKMIGLGLAVAILIDVLVVRFLLAPAVLLLLGDRAWWLPRRLDRVLPRMALEGSEPDAEPRPEPVAAGRHAP